MPAEHIAQNLAYINWTVLTSLAVGAFGAVVVARLRTSATRGFLSFTAFCAALFGLLAYLSDGALPAAVHGAVVQPDPELDLPRRLCLLAFTVLAFGYVLVLAGRGRAPAVGLAATGAGLGALLVGAIGWSQNPIGAVALFLQFGLLAAATGGVFAAMILGHWYLVTPKLPEGPLVLLARTLVAILGLQLLLFLVWIATGAGGGRAPFEPLVGPWALFVWLRLLVGLVFPLVVSWAAVQTARSRSMESATGLLYINVGSIAAGTILASGLYFGAGLLV